MTGLKNLLSMTSEYIQYVSLYTTKTSYILHVVFLRDFCTQLYDIKYSCQIQIIYAQLYGFKYSYLILIIFKQTYLDHRQDIGKSYHSLLFYSQVFSQMNSTNTVAFTDIVATDINKVHIMYHLK